MNKRKINKIKNIQADVYIQNVLSNWDKFCKAHRQFEQALIEMLEENKRLKNEVKRLMGENESEGKYARMGKKD